LIGTFVESGKFNIDRLYRKYSGTTAVIEGENSYLYRDLRKILSSTILSLEEMGIKKGSRIALCMRNSLYHPILLQASWIMGFTLVLYNPGAPVTAQADTVKPDLIISNDDPGTGDFRYIPPSLLTGKVSETDAGLPDAELDSESAVVFTSGSTGMPKGVVLTTGNFLYSAAGTVEQMEMTGSDSWLVSLPMFHVGGLIIPVRSLLAGGTAIITGDIRNLEEIIISASPSFLSLVPTQLIRMIKRKEAVAALKKCRGILLGGAPSPRWLISHCLEEKIPVLPTYGSTESCSQLTAVDPGFGEDEHYTSGRPLRHREVSIDKNSRIIIGGKVLFKKYIQGEEETLPQKDGKFVTGDMGYLDNKGNLVITGRADQVFLSGGENINPHEIEKEILRIKGIHQAYVVPAPDHELGSVPWAFLESENRIEGPRITEQLSESLPRFKIPRRYIRLNSDNEKIKQGREDLIKLASVMATGK
jgi:O-succinylbenzoic acid--CoA ligase